jgi:THAP domain
MIWIYDVNQNVSFPDDPDIFKQWCRNIRSVFFLGPKPMHEQKICSLHFAPADLIDPKTLRPNAVPIVHKFKYYFGDDTIPKRKSYETTTKDTCLLCYMLKSWKVKLTPANKLPIRLFP